MAFNGTGTFTRLYNWVNDKANGFKITASRMDGEFDGIATGLSTCITKDGQTTITANIPFANYKITGLGTGNARSDSLNIGQLQDNQFLYLGTTSGSADAYTLAPTPTITSYATTQQFTVKIHATNTTTTPYLQISGIANPSTTAVIKKLNASKAEIAVEASDLIANGIYKFQRNSANDAWIVLNPEKSYLNLVNATQATNSVRGISFLSNPIAIANNATTSSTDIDFSGGIINFSDGSGQAIAPALTKRLQSTGSWSAGAGGNMLLSGARANSSTYHLYAIYNPTTNTTEYGALLGVAGTSPDPTSVLPSGYTKFKRLASILTDGSANIRNASYTFFTGGYYCNYNSTISDASSISLTTTRASLAISTPRGINVIANVHPFFDIINARDTITIFEGGTSIPYFLIRGGANTIANAQVGSNGLVKTNKSSQIDWSTGAYSLTVSLNTYGFTDYTN